MYYLRTLPAANAIQFTAKKLKKDVDEKVNEITKNINNIEISEAGDTNGMKNVNESQICLMCSS